MGRGLSIDASIGLAAKYVCLSRHRPVPIRPEYAAARPCIMCRMGLTDLWGIAGCHLGHLVCVCPSRRRA